MTGPRSAPPGRRQRLPQPVEARFVCPTCLTASAAPCRRCLLPERPVDRRNPEGHPSIAHATRKAPWTAILVATLAIAVPLATAGSATSGWFVARWVVVWLLFSAAALWRQRGTPEAISVLPDGLAQIESDGRRVEIRWSDVCDCRLSDLSFGPEGLIVSDGIHTVFLSEWMAGYRSAKRAILTYTPVLTPCVGFWSRRASRKALYVTLVVAAVAAIVILELVRWQQTHGLFDALRPR